MKTPGSRAAAMVVLLAGSLAGCAVPRYDVPYNVAGPSATTIVRRIECELLQQVQDGSPTKEWLLTGDYQVAVALSLEVNDTGGLAPSLSYIDPLSKVASLTIGGTGTLSESRDHNFTENLQFSLRQIYTDWLEDPTLYPCPPADTNLAGTLGIGDFVELAFGSPGLADSDSKKSPFGGSVQFIVTKSANAVGPTWSLVHFKGPGGVNLSEINTDKVTLAFAKGPKQGTKLIVTNTFNKDAYLFLQQLLTSSINTQLLNLQYLFQSNPPGWLSLLPLP